MLMSPMTFRLNSGSPTMQFAGYKTLNSGTPFVTLSTTWINSDSLVNVGIDVRTTANSGQCFEIGVSSIVPGVSFAIGYIDGKGRGPGGRIMWEIRRTQS